MAPLLDPAGRSITLAAQPLATGGEGSIFELAGDPDHVAKVYKTAPTAEHAAKLRVMADLATPALLAVAAWPTATLHRTPGGPIAGVLLPKVAGSREIHHLYSVAQRKKDFPEADWRFLIQAARSCALAFEAVHAAGHVVGDVNQKNILVAESGAVRFVDCDSFQVTSPTGTVYRCGVGVPEFTPPELQGQSFRAVDRTVNHDRFGLAVLIFHLLMMGRHPFSGIYAGSGEMPLEAAIGAGRFAYSKSPERTEMRPPPGTPPVALLDPELYPLFERAFAVPAVDPRPTATEWAEALTRLLGQLAACPVDARHVFPRALGACPWCALVGTAGVFFFLPGTTGVIRTIADFRLTKVWPAIERWTVADFAYVRPEPQVRVRPRPVPRALGVPIPPPVPTEITRLGLGFEAIAALGLVVSLFLLCCARTVALVGLIGFSAWLVVLLATQPWRLAQVQRFAQASYRAERERWEAANQDWLAEFRRRIARRDQALAALAALEAPWQDEADAALAEYHAIRSPLDALKVRYEREAKKYETQRQATVKDAARLQRNQWLDAILIADHRINGISSTRLANLRSFGIETAADVEKLERGQVKVPQIGPKLTERLVAWRDEQAEGFRFDPDVPARAVGALERNHRALIDSWEVSLAAGPARLRDLAKRLRPRRSREFEAIQTAVEALHQAELDVAIMDRMLS